MNTQSNAASQVSNGNEAIMVVMPEQDKFRVYDARKPNITYEVGGTPDAPYCSCPEFRTNRENGGFRCGHVNAVFPHSGNGHPADSPALIGDHRPTDISPMQMSLKRSVSPDGRIDSLSVEFTGEVYGASDDEVVEQALQTTRLQTAIVNGYLGQRQTASATRARPDDPDTENSAQGEPAMLMLVSGMQTRVGWRYFINVQMGENEYKLFGTRDKLAEQLRNAGLGHATGNIAKGNVLNLPCRAVTRPSDDGKYINVERLLPAGEEDNNDVIPF